MDGNGRWAAARGLPVAAGHVRDEGVTAGHRGRDRPRYRVARRLRVLDRELVATPEEIETLIELFGETIDREFPDLAKQGVRARFIGRRDRVPDALREKMAALEAETAANERLLLWIAFDYGGRAELVEAARKLVSDGVEAEDVSEDSFAQRLDAPELPDPDLVIRTSGELRLSNFLLWQSAYSELVFTDALWPDFGPHSSRKRSTPTDSAADASAAAEG